MKKNIGLFTAICLVSGNMMGAGVLMLPATLAKYGAYSFSGWIITSIGALCLALVFAKLSHFIPHTGGPYYFAMHAFGKFVGFQMAWSYWIFTWVSNVALVVSGLSYMSIFIPEIQTMPALSMLIGLSAIVLFTYINTLDLRVFSFVQVLITISKLIPLLSFCIIGLFQFNMGVFSIPSELPATESITQTVALTLWAFIGLESATVPAGNVDNPKRTIPLATIIGVIGTAIIYILCSYSLMCIIPQNELSVSLAPYVDATRKLFGNNASYIMAFIGVFGIAGTLHGWTLILGQIPLSAAESGLFPAIFAKKNKHNTPIFGLIIGSALMCVFFLTSFCGSLTNQFNIIIEFSCFAILIPYIYSVSAAAVIGFRKRASFKSNFHFIMFLLCVAVGICYIFFAFIGLSSYIISIGMLVFFLSLPMYGFVECGDSKL